MPYSKRKRDRAKIPHDPRGILELIADAQQDFTKLGWNSRSGFVEGNQKL